jgi:hypothetical protein
MPAKDRYHDTVVHALQNDGWTILGEQVALLYLAVPATALTGILGEELGRRAVQQAQVGLIVFDPLREEIVEWRHYNTP